MSEKTYIDKENGLARMMGNQKLYARMLGLFLESKELDMLETALANGDTAKAAEAAHAVKGVAGNLGLPALFETSAELMNSLRQGVMDETMAETYRQDLAQTLSAVKGTLASMQPG